MTAVRQLVLQATGFCNIDCAYCYLPDRSARTLMTPEVVAATARALAASGRLGDALEVRWHAGEPLAAPRAFYASATRTLRSVLDTELRFSLQTNALLVDDAWCRFLAREGVRVGVSLDGPATVHDAYRRTRAGGGTHARAMKGVARLAGAGIPFDVISVITPVTLAHRDEYLEFMTELRPRSLGLNPEETEGGNVSTLHGTAGFRAGYRDFLRAVADWSDRTGVRVRELATMREHVLLHDLPVRNTQCEPYAILTVSAGGDVASFSPELLGWRSREHGDFLLGNVLEDGFALDRVRPGFARLAAEVARGRRACERACGYFALCGGGAPANKWAEHGTFACTETASCTLAIKTVADVVLDTLERTGTPG